MRVEREPAVGLDGELDGRVAEVGGDLGDGTAAQKGGNGIEVTQAVEGDLAGQTGPGRGLNPGGAPGRRSTPGAPLGAGSIPGAPLGAG